MPSLFRFCYVLFPLILSLASIILGALAIAGSTTNHNPINQTYLFKLNITGATSTVNSALASSSVSSLGLSDIYTFGLWGYCKGDSDNGSYKPTWCSDPKPMYIFNPVDTLENELDSTSDTLTLPSQFQDYVSTAKVVSKMIFICGIIGVAAAFLTGVLTLFSFCSHGVSCISVIIGLISFLSLLICAASSTGAFLILKKYLNNATDDYGITGGLDGYYFYGFIWAAVAAALIAVVFNFFGMCLGSTRSRSKSIEEEPMLYYEKH